MTAIPTAKDALERIALELERGCRDPLFFDGRGGFSASLAWYRGALDVGYWPEHREHIKSVLQECEEFLAASEVTGWDAVASQRAVALAKKIRAEA